MEVIAMRATTPITRKELWQELTITEGATAICTSVAVQKTGTQPEKVYVAYVDSTGLLTVKSAVARIPIRLMTWTTELTIADCAACSLEFEGHFRHFSRNVEFRTDETPYLAYLTTSGALYVGILGETPEQLAGANVTSVDMINGVSNTYDAQDQGFFVFYTINGGVYYNWYIDGEWQGQEQVTIAPSNAVKVKAERTFDWRVILHVQDSSGSVYEVFSKMEATGWNGTDFIWMDVSVSTELVDVYYSDYSGEERISLDVTADAWNMATYSPTLLRAWNIPTSMEDPENPGTYYDDYGYRVVFEFDECIRNATDYPAQFKLTDAYNASWYGQSVQQDYHSRFVTVTFTDFNNAGNDITATGLPGVLTNGLTPLATTSKIFTATGLVPTYVPAPVPLSVGNIQAFDWGD
jgi:hypothetical protein